MGEVSTEIGSVETDSLNISNSARVAVSGYDLFVTNKLDLRGDSPTSPANLNLTASMVRVGSITIHDFAEIDQSPSTNELTSGMTLEGGKYLITGGLLESPSIDVGLNANFSQLGGRDIVHGTLSISCTYYSSGGSLLTDGLYLRGSLRLMPTNSSPSFTNNGLTDLGGTLSTGWTDTWGGQARLSANAAVNFLGSRAQLRFASSSTLAWTPGALLTITNWNSSGNMRLYFGTDSSGLTASQLAQVRFVNPGGMSPGFYGAKINADGEVVPASSSTAPSITAQKTSNGLALTWPSGYTLQSATNAAGPYSDVTGASSPYTAAFTEPQKYFRLRQ
jgi:hypothetical protein